MQSAQNYAKFFYIRRPIWPSQQTCETTLCCWRKQYLGQAKALQIPPPGNLKDGQLEVFCIILFFFSLKLIASLFFIIPFQLMSMIILQKS